MFKGRTFIQKGGYQGWAIQFADQRKTPGVATTAYSYGMSGAERFEMARRITAALNLVRNYTTDEIEAAVLEATGGQGPKTESANPDVLPA